MDFDFRVGVEPLKRLRVTYEGELLLLDDPMQMADPRRAYRDNPKVRASLALDFEGISPIYGGTPVGDAGPLEGFAASHYEQHVRASGQMRVGDFDTALDALGLRDKSWGPRTWQAIRWYRWLPMTFADGFAAIVVATALLIPKEALLLHQQSTAIPTTAHQPQMVRLDKWY